MLSDMMQDDWDSFVTSAPWFVRGKERMAKLVPLPARSLAPGTASLFPHLGLLMQCASVTGVTTDRGHYELFGWTRSDGKRFGWLCLPPSLAPPTDLHEAHRALLRSFGGIVDRFNEPDDTWLLNHWDALTEYAAASSDPEAYAAVFDGPIPINANEYYPIALEANGNTTLCHRQTGSILLFAPDHAFDHITVLAGCPDYTFYTINGVKNFREWVEKVAQQWAKYATCSN
jgi:hypothetical protein